jgi:hypothetical protein
LPHFAGVEASIVEFATFSLEGASAGQRAQKAASDMARVFGSGLLAFAALSALSPDARAVNGLFCQGTLAYPEGRYVCVGSQATADYLPMVGSLGLGPDRWDVGVASTGEVASSNFGLSSAEVSVKVGTLSGKTHAEVLTTMPVGEQDANWSSGGLASAAFRDTVLIQGQPGVPLGTPVTAHLRTKVQGVFSAASAKNVFGASADFTGQVYLVHSTGCPRPCPGCSRRMTGTRAALPTRCCPT